MGNGYDLPATLPNLETILKMLLAYELIYSVSISTVKISVLLFYQPGVTHRHQSLTGIHRPLERCKHSPGVLDLPAFCEDLHYWHGG
jgi:hypothetical protein